MRKKRILLIIGGVFAVAGIVSIAFYMIQQGENKILLSLGAMCFSFASFLLCLTSRRQ